MLVRAYLWLGPDPKSGGDGGVLLPVLDEWLLGAVAAICPERRLYAVGHRDDPGRGGDDPDRQSVRPAHRAHLGAVGSVFSAIGWSGSGSPPNWCCLPPSFTCRRCKRSLVRPASSSRTGRFCSPGCPCCWWQTSFASGLLGGSSALNSRKRLPGGGSYEIHGHRLWSHGCGLIARA